MQSVEAERYWQQALALRPLGQEPNQPRQVVAEARNAGLEADLLVMPMLPLLALQNEDGEFFFLVDFDAVNGPSIIR